MQIIQTVVTIIVLLLCFYSVVKIVIGIYGIKSASAKHTKKQKSETQLKEGIAIFIVAIILYIAVRSLFVMFGFPIGSSFTGDTLVWTSEGRVRIEDLDIGDEVIGFDTQANSIVTEKVEQCRSYKVSSYYLVNGTLKVTSEHPFAVRQSEDIIWKKANELAVGDKLVAAEKLRPLVVERIEEVQSDESIRVYNPQVSGSQNYFVFVGDRNAALVHNKTTIPSLKEIPKCEHED